METESYNRYQAMLLLDNGRFVSKKVRTIIKNLLRELKEQDNQIEELKMANKSFADTFDTVAPEMEKMIKQAGRHGAEKALNRAGKLPDNELETPEPPKLLPSADDEV